MKKNLAIVETLRIGAGLLVCLGIMYGVYALLSLFSLKVFLGGILGYLLAMGNFFFMAISLLNISEDPTNPRGGLKMQGGYILRMLTIGVFLVIGYKSGYCDLVAGVIPLFLIRPVITVEQFFTKSGKQAGDQEKEKTKNGCADQTEVNTAKEE